MASRHDFPASVKRLLAARVAHRCSNPRCRAATSGPQLDENRTVNVGVGAHITAAAPGGPRYDQSLTAEERGGAENGIWLCQNCAKLIDSDIARFTSRVLWDWKEQAEVAARDEVGRTSEEPQLSFASDREAEIRRNLKLRDTLYKALLKPADQRRASRGVTHPYEKFRYHKIIVRSLEDTVYPRTRESPGISSWFRVELYDFYHSGIEVILWLDDAVVDGEGRWRPLGRGESYDETKHKQVKIWIIGQIPYRFIRAYDLDGDEYYNEPHLYCAFANGGEPYEAIRYSTVGEDDSYDWPLDDDRRLPSPVAV